MRSPPSAARSRTRGQHGNRTDAGHDLALGQMPMAHQPRPAISSQLVGVVAEKACNLGLHSLRQQRSRAIAQNFCQRIAESLWLGNLITLSWVMAYHSFGGEVEASNTPRYAASPRHAVTNFRA
jgi:hypothetical protein